MSCALSLVFSRSISFDFVACSDCLDVQIVPISLRLPTAGSVTIQLRQGDPPGSLELDHLVLLQQTFEVVDLLRPAGQHDRELVRPDAHPPPPEDAPPL